MANRLTDDNDAGRSNCGEFENLASTRIPTLIRSLTHRDQILQSDIHKQSILKLDDFL